MTYEIGKLLLESLLPAMARAEDQLARLDEIVRRSPAGEGFVERGHFFDAAASMWVAGELVHIEDLVLHDARMDVRAPTHELTIAHAILRSRRRIAGVEPSWAFSEAGLAALAGSAAIEPDRDFASPDPVGQVDLDSADERDDDPLAREFAHIDAVITRSQRVLEHLAEGVIPKPPERSLLAVGDLVIRDPDWDERERMAEWRNVLKATEEFPPVLSAALLFDAWETLEPLQRQHGLGGQLVAAHLRARGKVMSHLPTFHVGLKAVPRERRRAHGRTARLQAFLDAMSAAAEAGFKEIARLSHAREQMERKARGRRSSSSLPAAIELILSRPIVSAATVAKAAGVTPRGALNLIADLGIREATGRGRYRAWGVI
ncbi:RHE_PE00001 family protein [Mesorhizobium sp. CAU 1732]|uniref:RHE_PE00001 family protein n=1 Tax=Mesorhizobium sp. CAU 1732 TaxID=3140358 RepID=UPI003260F217